MLIARKSLSALQRRESLLHSLNRLTGRLSKVGPGRHAHGAERSLQTRGDSLRVACVGSSNTDFEPPSAALCPQKLFKSKRPHTGFVATESVTCLCQYTFNGTPGAVERCSRPCERHVFLKADPRHLVRSQLIRLGEGKLKSKYKHYLHGTRSLPASSRRAVNGPAIVATLPEPRVAGFPLCAHVAASCGQALLVASKHGTLIQKPCRKQAFSRSTSKMTSASCHSLGATAMAFAQPCTVRTISAATSGMPSRNWWVLRL